MKFYVRRKTGYLSSYSLGTWYVASVSAAEHFGREPSPVLEIRGRLFDVPWILMQPFRVFNRYRNLRGEIVSTFAWRRKRRGRW